MSLFLPYFLFRFVWIGSFVSYSHVEYFSNRFSVNTLQQCNGWSHFATTIGRKVQTLRLYVWKSLFKWAIRNSILHSSMNIYSHGRWQNNHFYAEWIKSARILCVSNSERVRERGEYSHSLFFVCRLFVQICKICQWIYWYIPNILKLRISEWIRISRIICEIFKA